MEACFAHKEGANRYEEDDGPDFGARRDVAYPLYEGAAKISIISKIITRPMQDRTRIRALIKGGNESLKSCKEGYGFSCNRAAYKEARKDLKFIAYKRPEGALRIDPCASGPGRPAGWICLTQSCQAQGYGSC